MPLFFEQCVPHNGVLGIWQISENEEYFFERLNLAESERYILQKIKGEGRRIQWLAVRYLLHHLTGREERATVLKDKFGKPYILESTHFISISHSNDMAAVVASDVPCGIDIQFPVDKIARIMPRFCSPEEQAYLKSSKDPFLAMHVLWGGKEAMYKAYGRRGLTYKADLSIPNADLLFERPGIGTLSKNKLSITYEIFAERVLDYVLTYCFEIDAK